MRPECQTGGCSSPAKYNGFNKDGSRRYHRWCSGCCKKRYNDTWKPVWERASDDWSTPYNGYEKRKYCEECGFEAVHRIQLDVDHIDGDRENNAHDNLRTLCANCHRLKTLRSKDYLPKKRPPSFY